MRGIITAFYMWVEVWMSSFKEAEHMQPPGVGKALPKVNCHFADTPLGNLRPQAEKGRKLHLNADELGPWHSDGVPG